MFSLQSRASSLLVATVLVGTPVTAQRLDCPYDRCALWMPYGSANHVVQGADTTPASVVGFIVPTVDLLAAADPVTRRHYMLARKQYSRTGAAGIASMATMVATIVYYGSGRREWRTPAGIGLPVAMVLSSAAAGAFGARADDHMRQAIWFYNGNLRSGPGTPMSTCPYYQCAIRLRGSQIVRGVDAIPVGRLGSQSTTDLFAQASDNSARVSFEAFLALQRKNEGLRLVSLGAALAGAIVLAAGDGTAIDVIGGGLLFSAYAIGHGLAVYAPVQEARHLEEAIWLYNRQFSAAR